MFANTYPCLHLHKYVHGDVNKLYIVSPSEIVKQVSKALFTQARFDLKHSCLDTFLPFVYTETSKNVYVHKNIF